MHASLKMKHSRIPYFQECYQNRVVDYHYGRCNFNSIQTLHVYIIVCRQLMSMKLICDLAWKAFDLAIPDKPFSEI